MDAPPASGLIMDTEDWTKNSELVARAYARNNTPVHVLLQTLPEYFDEIYEIYVLRRFVLAMSTQEHEVSEYKNRLRQFDEKREFPESFLQSVDVGEEGTTTIEMPVYQVLTGKIVEKHALLYVEISILVESGNKADALFLLPRVNDSSVQDVD